MTETTRIAPHPTPITRGRTVDYRPTNSQRITTTGDEVWTAIVTAVGPELVSLTAFPPGMAPLPVLAPIEPESWGGCWAWPQRA